MFFTPFPDVTIFYIYILIYILYIFSTNATIFQTKKVLKKNLKKGKKRKYRWQAEARSKDAPAASTISYSRVARAMNGEGEGATIQIHPVAA